jgi:hypothetical protein
VSRHYPYQGTYILLLPGPSDGSRWGGEGLSVGGTAGAVDGKSDGVGIREDSLAVTRRVLCRCDGILMDI